MRNAVVGLYGLTVGRKIPNQKYLVFALGHLFLVAALFIFNITVAKVLGPAMVGVWQTAVLISMYGSLISLGILNGVGREIPFFRGKKDFRSIETATSTALWFTTISLVVFIGVAVGIAFRMDSYAPAVLIGSVLLSARIMNSLSRVILRSFQEFFRFGVHQAFTALVLLAGLPLVIRFPEYWTVTTVMTVALGGAIVVSRRYLAMQAFSWNVCKRLIRVGLPIMLTGICFTLLTTADQVVILVLLDVERLGLYAPAVTVFGALLVVPGILSNVIYPHMAKVYGQEGSIRVLGDSIRRLVVMNYMVTLLVAGALGVSFYKYIIPIYLPEFEAARLPICILLASGLFLPLGISLGDFFNVVGLERAYLRNMCIALATNVLSSSLMVSVFQWDLLGVAIGTVVGVFVYALMQLSTFTFVWRQS